MMRATRHAKTPGAPRPRPRLAGCLALALAICLAPIAARSSDHDEARRLRESGQILPLQQVLSRHRHRLGNQVLDVDLQKRGDRYVYEVETLDKRNKAKKHYFDATTGRRLGSGRRK